MSSVKQISKRREKLGIKIVEMEIRFTGCKKVEDEMKRNNI